MISAVLWSPWLSSPTGRPALRARPDQIEQVVGARFDLRLSPCADSHMRSRKPDGDLDGNPEVLPDCQPREDLGDLKGAGEAAPDSPRRQQIGHILVVKDDAAGIRRDEAADQD